MLSLMSTHVCPVEETGQVDISTLVLTWIKLQFAECNQKRLFCTSLAEEGEFFVAVFGVPAVQAPLVHALDLKALQLGTEHVILGWVRPAEISQTLRRQKHLHGPCEEQTAAWGNSFKRPQMWKVLYKNINAFSS